MAMSSARASVGASPSRRGAGSPGTVGAGWRWTGRLARVAAAGIGVAVLLGGCGRSFRIVHRGDVHFERCYGSDFDPRIPPEYKLGCWTAWLRHYTFGQPLHRVQYAESRVAAIAAGLPGPHLPTAPVYAIVAPAYAGDATTAAQAQPADPATAQPDPPGETPPLLPGEPPPPESRCTAICRTDWNACVPACSQPEVRDRCRYACDEEFRTCMRGCF